jgi:DNA-binding FadR family transcriptional regulator
MMIPMSALPLPRLKLHDQVTSALALRVLRADRRDADRALPNEAALCEELAVSRSILRESMKVLADKRMVEMRPRTGTRARPRAEWKLLDPDILAWQSQLDPDPQFLLDLCEVRLAIEPTAAGFAAVRATGEELDAIALSLARRETLAPGACLDEIIDADLAVHAAVVAASHNPMLGYLSTAVREPFRAALVYILRYPANLSLGLEAHYALLEALRAHDPMAARKAAEQSIGLAMVAVEAAARATARKGKLTQ